MNITSKFDAEKSAEAIIFLAQSVPEPTFMALAKLLYFADKTSLEKYGRSITGDTYYAMRHGPVPSQCYDMMKRAKEPVSYGFHVEYEKHVIPDRPVNLNKLSKSDIKCLEKIVAAYGNYPVWQLRELSHDEAWHKAWASVGDALRVQIPIEDIVSALDDEEDELLVFFKDTHKPERGID